MATNRLCAIAYDATSPTLDRTEFRKYMKSVDIFTNWWNHIPGLYIVTTDRSNEEVFSELQNFSKNLNFLVFDFNLTNAEGWLPERAWQWLIKYDAIK